MKIQTLEQLERVRKDCRKIVTKRALTAGVTSAVPAAIVGAGADAIMLYELLPKINKRFGLDPEQMDELDEQIKQQVMVLATSIGSHVIGQNITKEVVLMILKTVGVRATAKSAASMVPFIGSAVGAVLGFGMMKYVGNQHVEECYEVVKQILESRESVALAA